MCVKLLSRVRLFATPWTVARQAPLSMGFSRQEYWSGLPFPSPGDLCNPGIKPRSSGGSDGKESACNAGDPGLIPSWEDPLEEVLATHSGILAWRIPWTEEPDGLQSTGSQRVRHDLTINIFTFCKST